jgi:hypothetical protein
MAVAMIYPEAKKLKRKGAASRKSRAEERLSSLQ